MKFCIQRLISEVEARPVIWDSRTREYSERAAKKEAWEELCAAFVPEYYESTDAERSGITATLQKKWKSVRDAFLRELKKSNSASGSGLKFSKQYAYYDNLMFLKPIYELRRERDDDDTMFFHNDSAIVETEHNEDSDNDSRCSANFADTKATEKEKDTTQLALKRKRTEDKDDRMLNMLEDHLKKKRKDSVLNDPDRQFLLSLLPDLQSIDASIKFDLKFEIMRVLKTFKTQSSKLMEEK